MGRDGKKVVSRLAWDLKYSDLGWSVESGLKKGRPAPDWYYEKQELSEREVWVTNAFWDLNTERSTGMGVGPIPFSKIITYGEFYDLPKTISRDFARVIRQMDATYLKFQADQRQNKP